MFSPSKLFSVICLFGLSIADLFPVILWFTWGVPIEKPVFELGSVLALLHLHSRGWSRACSSSCPRFSFFFFFVFQLQFLFSFGLFVSTEAIPATLIPIASAHFKIHPGHAIMHRPQPPPLRNFPPL